MVLVALAFVKGRLPACPFHDDASERVAEKNDRFVGGAGELKTLKSVQLSVFCRGDTALARRSAARFATRLWAWWWIRSGDG